jgi:hypothetical protein
MSIAMLFALHLLKAMHKLTASPKHVFYVLAHLLDFAV